MMMRSCSTAAPIEGHDDIICVGKRVIDILGTTTPTTTQEE